MSSPSPRSPKDVTAMSPCDGDVQNGDFKALVDRHVEAAGKPLQAQFFRVKPKRKAPESEPWCRKLARRSPSVSASDQHQHLQEIRYDELSGAWVVQGASPSSSEKSMLDFDPWMRLIGRRGQGSPVDTMSTTSSPNSASKVVANSHELDGERDRVKDISPPPTPPTVCSDLPATSASSPSDASTLFTDTDVSQSVTLGSQDTFEELSHSD